MKWLELKILRSFDQIMLYLQEHANSTVKAPMRSMNHTRAWFKVFTCFDKYSSYNNRWKCQKVQYDKASEQEFDCFSFAWSFHKSKTCTTDIDGNIRSY